MPARVEQGQKEPKASALAQVGRLSGIPLKTKGELLLAHIFNLNKRRFLILVTRYKDNLVIVSFLRV